MTNWVKLWTTLHDDPGVRRLSDKAFRLYINAMSYCGLHDTDGLYEVFGKGSRELEELVEAGKFHRTDSPNHYLIHGWAKRQRSVADIAAQSAAGKAAADARWHAKEGAEGSAEGNANRIAERDTNGNAHKNRIEKSRGEQRELLASKPRRDELFETVAEVCGVNWHELTPSARGSMNKSVAQLRGVGATAEEVRRRAGNWPYETPLTAPSLAKHWPTLGTFRATPVRSNGKDAEIRELITDLEEQGL